MNQPLFNTSQIQSKYKHVISLGGHCQPAHQIKRILNINHSHVFDWLITPNVALVTTLEKQFKGFFDKALLTKDAKGNVLNRETGIRFVHEFDTDEDINLNYQQKNEKFQTLVKRFLNVLHGTDPVLFVRQHLGEEDHIFRALELANLISRIAPFLDFTILYLVNSARVVSPEWENDRLICKHITQPEPYVWTGDDREWERLLSGALLSNKKSLYHPLIHAKDAILEQKFKN